MNSQVVRLAVPSIIASITVPFVGIVDLAIAGHIGDALTMSGVVIGTMLFDLIYWNMGFLRVGTAGLTAQAFGRKDHAGMTQPLLQGVVTAAAMALLLLALQWPLVKLILHLLNCTPDVQAMASRYYYIRIWALPATLQLFVMRGWFIGMQNTRFQMIVDVCVNLINISASFLLAVYTPLAFNGIALGTVVAQWSGLAIALALFATRYRHLIPYISWRDSLTREKLRFFFRLNGDNFVRSVMMQVIYCGFTFFATDFGEVQLALSAVMMKMLLLFSFFVDGFAFAGEALTGRFIGEREPKKLQQMVRVVMLWGVAIGLVFTMGYMVAGQWTVALFTGDEAVIEASHDFLFWLYLMPVISCLAFIWDGIYIGATASAPMRNAMIAAACLFVASFYVLRPWLGIQALYCAYFVHLLVRSSFLTITSRRSIPYLA
ncbi:MAG: MATE family efflux transporter [Paludibacteraceae bacterium]|nr:MATE family efflux transporter [Paludibacteraceae bacterium]